jgi:hypothetical protein
MRNDDLAYDGTAKDAEKFKALQKAYEQQKRDEHEARETHRREVALSVHRGHERFDSDAFDKETAEQRKQFDEYKAKQDESDRRRQEYLNAQAFMAANPSYIPNPSNSHNLQAYLKKEGLPASPENLQAAFNQLSPILDLKQEVHKPPRVYSESEIRNMPLTPTDEWGDDGQISLLEVCHEQARQNMSLEIAQIEQDGKEQW